MAGILVRLPWYTKLKLPKNGDEKAQRYSGEP